MLQKHFKPFYF